MRRYFTRPKAWCEDDFISEDNSRPDNLTVFDYDSEPTGLLDAEGRELMASNKGPLGFLTS